MDGNLPFDFRAAVVLCFRDDDILDIELWIFKVEFPPAQMQAVDDSCEQQKK